MPRIERWTTIKPDGTQQDVVFTVTDHGCIMMSYELFARLCKLLGFTKISEEQR